MTLKRSSEKVQFWRDLLDEQSRTGMTVKAFCEKKGVSVPSFYSWRNKIQRKDAAVSRDGAKDHDGLVPVTVTAPLKDRATDATHRHADGIEIVTPGGFTLRVRRDLHPDNIARLLEAIEACRCGARSC
jgi:hypothetical protein